MNFKTLYDKIAVMANDQQTTSAGGIIIPDTAKEKPQEGTVVAVGNGHRDEKGAFHPLEVKVGNKVLYGKWSGTEVKIDGKEYVIMKESDLLAIKV